MEYNKQNYDLGVSPVVGVILMVVISLTLSFAITIGISYVVITGVFDYPVRYSVIVGVVWALFVTGLGISSVYKEIKETFRPEGEESELEQL